MYSVSQAMGLWWKLGVLTNAGSTNSCNRAKEGMYSDLYKTMVTMMPKTDKDTLRNTLIAQFFWYHSCNTQ